MNLDSSMIKLKIEKSDKI